MSTLTATHTVLGTTSLDRMLLRAASGIDRLVAARIVRRVDATDAARAWERADDARRRAQALGALGMLPR
jgi:hypothetical protein